MLWIYSLLKLVLNSFIFFTQKNSKFCGLSPVPGQNFISLHTVRGVESHPGIGFPPPFLTNFYRKRGRGTQWVKKRVHQGTKNCHFLAKFVSVNTFVIFFLNWALYECNRDTFPLIIAVFLLTLCPPHLYTNCLLYECIYINIL